MAEKFDRGLENREIVLDILTEVLENGAFVHQVLGQALYKYQYLDKADRAFITRAAEGTLDYLIQIDFVIDKYASTPLAKMKPFIRTLLRMSVYQILHMDRVPDFAVCSEAVKLAKKRHFGGLGGFVNGILRKISREKASLAFDCPSLRYSVPEWMYKLWEAEYGAGRAQAICAAFLEDRPLWVRCCQSRASVEETRKLLEADGVEAAPFPGMEYMLSLSGVDRLERVRAFREGFIQVQDVSSALVGEIAAPRPGDYVIDVCAAPGGKSLHLADKMGGSGTVEARDLSPRKVALIEENISRCQAANVEAVLQDALVFDPASEEKADIVLADLPCSGLGIMGRKPDIKGRMTRQTQRDLAALQREILSVVWRYVKPGGILIYSTCTIDRLENEDNAAWFLKEFPFIPLDIGERLPAGVEGISAQKGMLQLLPGMNPFDGFFISLFKRQE